MNQKEAQKYASQQLAMYKKRLKDSVEINELQVRELEAKIKFHELRVKWFEMQDNVDAFDAKIEAIEKENQEKIRKEQEENKNKIEQVKVGKPRTEEEIEKAKEIIT